MIKRNKNYTNLAKGYLFPEIAKRRKAFQAQHPEAKIISLGIGNTTEPLAPHIVEEMKNFVEALGTKEGYEGYQDDSAGMPKLRERISKAIYNGEIKPSEENSMNECHIKSYSRTRPTVVSRFSPKSGFLARSIPLLKIFMLYMIFSSVESAPSPEPRPAEPCIESSNWLYGVFESCP